MRAPYRNLDLEDGIELEEIDRKPGPSKELLALFMQDLMNKEKGKVAPDTTGADYFFLEEFITRDMELDIAFPGKGIKRLLAAFAPIKKV